MGEKLVAIDYFCGAGGAARGLQMAGFYVIGIDKNPQPRYAGDEFHQGGALDFDAARGDFLWASPPCKAHVSLRWMHNAKKHEDLIPPTRAKLKASGKPWCMENVVGAPLRSGLQLCGTMFDLQTEDAELWRHRRFELSWQMPLFGLPHCEHGQKPRVIGVYGGHGRDRRRTVNTQDFSVAERRQAMGIDWMTGEELSQAIPPAYARFIGEAAIAHIRLQRLAA